MTRRTGHYAITGTVILVFVLLLFLVSCQSIPKGTYVGNVSMPGFSDDENDQWYYESRLTIEGTSVTLEQSPFHIKDGDKIYSASDGGFFYYQGTVVRTGDKYHILLDMTNCDYCGIPYTRNPQINSDESAEAGMSFREKVDKGIYIVDPSFKHKEYQLTPQKDGSLMMDGVRYMP
jgi:hypothetical protein